MNSRKFDSYLYATVYTVIHHETEHRPYQNGSNSCYLSLEEKIANTTVQGNPVNTPNQRTEIVSKCQH